MARQNAVALVVLLLAVVLAGCIGDDDTPVTTSRDAAEAVATSKTGSITGQIVTVDLEILVGVEIGITNRSGALTTTTTDTQGRFTFNDLKPGQYRVQLVDECCKLKTANVAVEAGKVTEVNMQVERTTAADRDVPYVVEQQWDGFLACGLAVGGNTDERCGEADANHVIHKVIKVNQGLQELVTALDWDPSATAVSEDLRYTLHRPGNGTGDRRCRLFLEAGPPPLTASATEANGDQCEQLRFSAINGTMRLQFSVAVGGIGATYQQAFTLYWYEFYHQTARLDFNPLPDR